MTNLKLYTPAGPIVAWRARGREPFAYRLPGGELGEVRAERGGVRRTLGVLTQVAADRYGGVVDVEAFEELPNGRIRPIAAHIG